MKPLNKIKIQWSPSFAYAIGLIVTDGNLSTDGRHINFTSKDEELVLLFKACLNLSNKIGKKARGGELEKKYFVVQFGDINFYRFLLDIGLTPAKSKTIGALKIDNDFFSDFLRGCIDGDGSIRTARHPESQHPQLQLRLYSASPIFLKWIKEKINHNVPISGGWIKPAVSIWVLAFGKSDSIKLINFLYYNNCKCYLERKYLVAKPFLEIISPSGGTGIHA